MPVHAHTHTSTLTLKRTDSPPQAGRATDGRAHVRAHTLSSKEGRRADTGAGGPVCSCVQRLKARYMVALIAERLWSPTTPPRWCVFVPNGSQVLGFFSRAIEIPELV